MSRKRRAGYTMIEVMMAIGVLTAGSVAIMAMIGAATRGNMEARQMTTANVVAQQWVERLRRDGLNWTRSSNTADPTLLSTTTYLSNVAAPGSAPLWFVPTPPATSGETANFDFYGNDLASPESTGTPTYCTNVRLEWLYTGRVIRADVRVWWMRRAGGSGPVSGDAAALVGCAPGVDPNTLTGNRNVHMIYTSTIIRYTPRSS